MNKLKRKIGLCIEFHNKKAECEKIARQVQEKRGAASYGGGAASQREWFADVVWEQSIPTNIWREH